ncbi:MAG: hypothetical protein EU541_07835, partial [Promethearchaeota archaeon]
MEISHEDTWDSFLDEFFEIFSPSHLLKKKILILGSYITENFIKLQRVRDEINKDERHLAFFELTFSRFHNQNLVFKFDLLARISDELLFIVEHDKGGHMIELGIVLAVNEYLQKTKMFVLKNAPITQMLTKGSLLTPFFKTKSSLFYFESIDD